MSNLNFLVHLFVLLLLQLGIFDNIQFNSYVYINIYVLAIYLLPYRVRNAGILVFGCLLGIVADLANNTMGVHMGAATLVAYLRPYLLQHTSNREQVDELQDQQRSRDFKWFFRYMALSTLIFNTALILGETFSLGNFHITLMRICCSTLASVFFILLYYWVAVRRRKD